MNSETTEEFWKCYKELPPEIKQKAKKVFQLFQKNPYHPSLRFKRIHSTFPVYSVRITRDYRAIGVREGNTIIWFWIGSHSDYEQMVNRL